MITHKGYIGMTRIIGNTSLTRRNEMDTKTGKKSVVDVLAEFGVNMTIRMAEVAEDQYRVADVRWWLAAKELERRMDGKIKASSYCPLTRDRFMAWNCDSLCYKLWPDLRATRHCPCWDDKPVEEVFKGIADISDSLNNEGHPNIFKNCRSSDPCYPVDILMHDYMFNKINDKPKPKSKPEPERKYALGDIMQNIHTKALYAFLRTRNIICMICLSDTTRNMIRNSSKPVLDHWDIKLGDFVSNPKEWEYYGNITTILTNSNGKAESFSSKTGMKI